jgi:hypothetical protein
MTIKYNNKSDSSGLVLPLFLLIDRNSACDDRHAAKGYREA